MVEYQREETEALLGNVQGAVECLPCWRLPAWCGPPKMPKCGVGEPVGERKASLRRVLRHSPDESSSATAFSQLPTRQSQRFSLAGVLTSADLETDRLVTVVPGYQGAPKILRYDIKELIKRGGIATLLHFGTIVHSGIESSGTLLRGLGVILLIVLSSFLLAFVAAAGDLWELQSIDMSALDRLMADINTMTVFTLGQYIVICLARWWSIRTLALQAVYDAFADLCTLLACELRGSKWQQVRMQVQKYGFASVELVFMAAREESDVSRLVCDGLLSRREADFLLEQPMPWQRPMALWAWITRIASDALEFQQSAHKARGMVTQRCLAAIQGIATVTKYTETQLPFAYVHLVMLMVNVQNVILALKTGIGMAQAVSKEDMMVLVPEALGCGLVCFLYHALLHMSCLILDPFGNSSLAFPMKAQLVYLAASIEAASQAQLECLNVASDGSLWRPTDDEVSSALRAEIASSRSFGSEVSDESSSEQVELSFIAAGSSGTCSY